MGKKITYGFKVDKKTVKGKIKSSRIRQRDKRNPTRALARIVDDEYKISDSSKYKGIHVGGKVYSKENKEPKKQLYKPQKPRYVGIPKKKYGTVDNLKKK